MRDLSTKVQVLHVPYVQTESENSCGPYLGSFLIPCSLSRSINPIYFSTVLHLSISYPFKLLLICLSLSMPLSVCLSASLFQSLFTYIHRFFFMFKQYILYTNMYFIFKSLHVLTKVYSFYHITQFYIFLKIHMNVVMLYKLLKLLCVLFNNVFLSHLH